MIVGMILFGIEFVTGLFGKVYLLEAYDKRSDTDLNEDLGYPTDWKSVLNKKDETIVALTLQNKILSRKLGQAGGSTGGWAGQILEKVSTGFNK